MYKIIRDTESKKQADEFMNSIGGDGFMENQGYKVSFKRYGQDQDDWAMVINYEDKSILVHNDELEKIIL